MLLAVSLCCGVTGGVCAAPSVTGQSKIDSLIERASEASKKKHFDRVALTARQLLSIGKHSGNSKATLYGEIYMGHSLASEMNDSVPVYYARALKLAAETSDDYATALVNNALAIYTSEIEMNPTLGLSYFMQALESAEKNGDERIYDIILCNLAMSYHRRGDTGGLKYALEVLDKGIARGDAFLIYSGALVTAYMYYLTEDYPTALRYIEMSIDNGRDYIEPVETYSLYANILAKTGREREAVEYYRRSIASVGRERSNTLAYLNYGTYLIEKGDYDRAIELLEQGLAFVDKRNNAFYRYRLYEKLSDAYERAGVPRRALEYYKRFHFESDSIFNVTRERAINEFRAKYEYEKQEKELQEKEVKLMSKSKNLNVTIFVIVILVGLSVALWLLYRSKNLRYRQIVRQQHDLLRKEKQLEELSEKYVASSLSEEKGQNLFAEFERLVKVDKIYRDSSITIDKAAKMLSTNRSYLSQVINEQSVGSFLQYIASARIDEARRVLSDPAVDVQMKSLAYDLGFSTPETFSSSFKNEIGMSPSTFRDEMRKISGKP